jgi:molybdate transport system regulatory protein
MGKGKTGKQARGQEDQPLSRPERTSHGRILAGPECSRCLDTMQLSRLEQAFRDWVEDTPRSDVRLSRRRILLIFLLIRYTGARLNEVLALNPFGDIELDRHMVVFGRSEAGHDRPAR